MNFVTHFKHPEQNQGNFIRFYCGKLSHVTRDKYLFTENRDEVTCNSCLDRIDNPVRALKQYGDIHICPNHISMRPLPFTKLYASVVRDFKSDNWRFVLYTRDSLLADETHVCHVSKRVIQKLLELVENQISIQDE